MIPYTIYNVDLEEQVDVFDCIQEQCPYYLIIWWRQIPLGYLYIEANEMLDRSELQLKIIRAIKPCVDFYQANSEFTEKNYISAFLSDNVKEFSAIMKEIFLPFDLYVATQEIDISVIVCTHNRSNSLYSCLQSLQNQQYQPHEIIVVDNSPSDPSTKDIVDKFQNIVYCKEEKPGLSVARNTGISLTKAPIVAFVDDDVKVHPLWCLRVWETFRLPEVMAMTGLILPSSLETESQQLFEKYWGFTKNYCDRNFDYNFIENQLERGPAVWTIGAGANMAFRKSVFDSVGLFDERLGAGASGCSEDSELWFRILLNKYRISYNPRAITFHTHRKELTSLKNQLFNYARGHVTAALIQEQAIESAGYKKRVFVEYPKYYLRRLIKGFPLYRLKNRTLFYEIKGWYEGIQLSRQLSRKSFLKLNSSQTIITEAVQSTKVI